MTKLSYSQAGQDIFVINCLNHKKNGIFLDLGCSDPIIINNTYLLETQYGWKGLSVDIDKTMTDKYVNRNTHVWDLDATKLDFNSVIEICTDKIDYLSLDLEPAAETFNCLQTIPFDRIDFSIITYEHDFWRYGDEYRDKSRELLTKHGYKIICANVLSFDNIVFEDWYYNPKYIDYKNIKHFESDGEKWQTILDRCLDHQPKFGSEES